MSNTPDSPLILLKKQFQTLLQHAPANYRGEIDGDLGLKSDEAWQRLVHADDNPMRHHVTASSFADPADVRAFERCKARGGTDDECYHVGDNGLGKWGHITAQDHTPMAALPYEVWEAAGKTGGARLAVTYNDIRVEGILGDTMPHLAKIKNGAGMDLNPGFQKAFGLNPPFLRPVEWEWL